MQISRINSNGTNFRAKLSTEVTRQLRGVLGDYIRNGEIDLYEKSLSKIKDLKTLCPNGKLVSEDFSYIAYDSSFITPIVVLKRLDYQDKRVYVGKINSFENISELANNLKKVAEKSSINKSKYDDFQIKEILDNDLPIGG